MLVIRDLQELQIQGRQGGGDEGKEGEGGGRGNEERERAKVLGQRFDERGGGEVGEEE